MVKQYISAVLQDLLGEYILNISKENLKIAALKGKIKLDHVELDGDFIGSHILGAVGVSGFGVLSCWAESLQISVPWTNLDEPTILEIKGMHLICVPLLPTTATRLYYGGGFSGEISSTQQTLPNVMKRCALRTRAKRSALARFERNFFSGRISGEGPQVEKETGDSKTLKYNGRKQQWSISMNDCFYDTNLKKDVDFSAIEGSPETSQMHYISSENDNKESSDFNSHKSYQKQKLGRFPALKEKIKSKVYRNLISSVSDVHIRFEVPERGLNMTFRRAYNDSQAHYNAIKMKHDISDQKSFAFGVTLKSLSIKNVAECQSSKDNLREPKVPGAVDQAKTAGGDLNDFSNDSTRTCKAIEIDEMSIYWDDDPPYLLTESDALQGVASIPISKLQRRIAKAMRRLVDCQDPGYDVIENLNSPSRYIKKKRNKSVILSRSHDYICTNTSLTINTTLTRGVSEESSYFIEVLPFKLNISATSQQYRQYQLLKNAVFSQQRLDTMLHCQPKKTPCEDPRSWWKYAIACVRHKPYSRPWSDVLQIVRCRERYIDLVVKNLQTDTEQGGFHGGLSRQESNDLFQIENLLPIETLLAFHLLALRNVFDKRCNGETVDKRSRGNFLTKRSSSTSLSRLWKSVTGSKSSWQELEEDSNDIIGLLSFNSFLDSKDHFFSTEMNAATVMERNDTVGAIDRVPRIGTFCNLNKCQLRFSLLENSERKKLIEVEIDIRGTSSISGDGNGDITCDIMCFNIFDFVTCSTPNGSKVLSVEQSTKQKSKEVRVKNIIRNDFLMIDDTLQPSFLNDNTPDRPAPSSSYIAHDPFRDLLLIPENRLPQRVVCRVNAVAHIDQLSIVLIAHPATIVWNNSCAEAVADFFSSSTQDIRHQFFNKIRSAATPGAHRAQIALLYPTSFSISIDMDAPKLWIPVSSRMIDSALFIDAGKLKLTLCKPKRTSETKWNLDVNDIQIMFARSAYRGVPEKLDDSMDLNAISSFHKEFIIIHPFQIIANGHATDSFEIPLKNSQPDVTKETVVRSISASVGNVRLNLVDVEELAKAFGRFYASEIIRMKKKPRSHSSVNEMMYLHSVPPLVKRSESSGGASMDSPSFKLTIFLEQIEVALESYIPKETRRSPKSMEPIKNRTYLMKIQCVKLQKRSKFLKQITCLTIDDISIVQLSEVSDFQRPRCLEPSSQAQHQILEKKNMADRCNTSAFAQRYDDLPQRLSHKKDQPYSSARKPNKIPSNSILNGVESQCQGEAVASSSTQFIRGCHFHDEKNHVDEVEFDVVDAIVRVTPTSILDLKIALTRLVELVQLTSREMERKVHEGGRKARISRSKSRAFSAGLNATVLSPSVSLPDDDCSNVEDEGIDSSIIFRVTFRRASILVGRPASEFTSSRSSRRNGYDPHDYVVQILTNASVLFQSIENPDCSGSKTAHLSLEDFSSSITTSFEDFEGVPYESKKQSANDGGQKHSFTRGVPPTAADLRVVYQTVDEGHIVSQDLTFNCESLKCCMLPHDITIVFSVTRKIIERLQASKTWADQRVQSIKSRRVKSFLSSMFEFRSKGNGIATKISADLSTFSFIYIHTFKSSHGTRPFLDLNMEQLKLRVDGVAASLSGDLTTAAKVNFYHPISGWEHFVEPLSLQTTIELLPDTLLFSISTPDVVSINFTGVFLQEISNLERSKKHGNVIIESNSFDHCSQIASLKSTVFVNYTGMDLKLSLDYSCHHIELERQEEIIPQGSNVVLSELFSQMDDVESCSITLNGPYRRPLRNLPLVSLNEARFLYKWRSSYVEDVSVDKSYSEKPETYDMEPIVESVMQNQRLRSCVADVFSLERGRDLLSSTTWSPEFHFLDGFTGSSTSIPLWQKPYLEGDVPEFTDMTFMFRKSKESFSLPNDDWIWANDWEVEVNCDLGMTNDADGWGYESDFETFSSMSRFYKRGDTCRRRRWTRTRIIKPPALDDPRKVMQLVWELGKEDGGNVTIKARSHLSLLNHTSMTLTFFGYCESWKTDELIGTVHPGATFHVPLLLASATYLRVAVPKKNVDVSALHINECFASKRIMILPTGFISNRIIQTSVLCDNDETRSRHGLTTLKILHMLLILQIDEGVCDIRIEPVLSLINLLPCQIQCQLGESVGCSGMKGIKVVQKEELSIDIGHEEKCFSIDCSHIPHISIRLPGYRWSSWNRIVNRHLNSDTWLPTMEEEAALFDAFKDDVEHAREFKTIVHLDHKCSGGESVNIIMSVESGHTPKIRLYAQYWILDKTGFGLRFTDSFNDIMRSKPEPSSLRKSYSAVNSIDRSELKLDMKRTGCEWSMGMNGMTLFFSRRERISVSVEYGAEGDTGLQHQSNSNWSSLIDVSKVIPKTVISMDECDGSKRFELAFDVTLCPALFSRTKMITFFPRYQIANLLADGIYVAQSGALYSSTYIPSQSWVPMHWENSSLSPKIRIALQVSKSPDIWSRGCIQLDQIGITAIRIPSSTSKITKVVQVEVRLATKKQSSAVVIVVWSSIEKSNPLYLLRNCSTHTIFCSQPLMVENKDEENVLSRIECFSEDHVEKLHQKSSSLSKVGRKRFPQNSFPHNNSTCLLNKLFHCTITECGSTCNGGDLDHSTLEDVFIWTLKPGESAGFGFDNPEMPHILEWTCLTSNALLLKGESCGVGLIDVDVMGSISTVQLSTGEVVRCEILAEESTKLIVFSNADCAVLDKDENEIVSLTLRIELPGITVSIIDNICDLGHGRSYSELNLSNNVPKEIILVTTERWYLSFSQTREEYHELEIKLATLQVDNFIFNAEFPVLVYVPKRDEEPFTHVSIVRHLNEHESTIVISYAALRILEIDVCLDRKTIETLANFLHPLRKAKEETINVESWISALTLKMSSNYSKPNRRAPHDVEKMIHSANNGRIYVERLYLHPMRISLSFTQEWLEWNPVTEGLVIFQLIRGIASIADAPLTFTSFLVENAFESPQSLLSIIIAHYSSQLTNQILTILGSLAILKAPVEFVSNIGSGVIRFFYEPINGLVHGPEHFLEGLESGTQSLARGVFTGLVRGAANLTELVNNNLVTLASDDAFADTRRAYRKQLMHGISTRTIQNSLSLARACVVRGIKSGAKGIVEQPAIYASRHGTLGLVKGVGKAIVGAIVKPIVGVGDAIVVVMNHVSDATSEIDIVVKENKRMRRALPRILTPFGFSVNLIQYDTISAKAQNIVTGGETVNDAYLGHVTISSHLIISSSSCLWVIDKNLREPWCIHWAEISHFAIDREKRMIISVFSTQGPKSYFFDMHPSDLDRFHNLLSMQVQKMGNCMKGIDRGPIYSLGTISYSNLPGIKSTQAVHVFGSINKHLKIQASDLGDEHRLMEKCYKRVNELSSILPNFFIRLDQEAWLLVNSWCQMFTGLSSRRCISIGILNGTMETIQIKSARVVEGASPCYIIPTMEYDACHGTLSPGGAIIVFGWGAAPSLLQPGKVYINIESNVFVCGLSDNKGHPTTLHSPPEYQVGFLEKSFDESGWWAKYWILIQREIH